MLDTNQKNNNGDKTTWGKLRWVGVEHGFSPRRSPRTYKSPGSTGERDGGGRRKQIQTDLSPLCYHPRQSSPAFGPVAEHAGHHEKTQPRISRNEVKSLVPQTTHKEPKNERATTFHLWLFKLSLPDHEKKHTHPRIDKATPHMCARAIRNPSTRLAPPGAAINPCKGWLPPLASTTLDRLDPAPCTRRAVCMPKLQRYPGLTARLAAAFVDPCSVDHTRQNKTDCGETTRQNRQKKKYPAPTNQESSGP